MIEAAFIVALAALFLHATTWEGMINEWVAKVAFSWPPWIKKPLFDCPICMAPWWGSAILACMGLYSSNWIDPLSWILILFAAGGINTVLIYIISYAKANDKE